MTNRRPIAFAGFSAFERSALASAFRLALHRPQGYRQAASLAEGDFVVADSDHPAVVSELAAAGLLGRTVFIGSHAPPGAAAWMMRPIDPLHVLRELDTLVARMNEPAGAATIAPYSLPNAAGHATTARPADAEAQMRRSGDTIPPPIMLRRSASSRRRRDADVPESREALLVDDSEIALCLLEVKLQRLGLRTRLARTSQEALREIESLPPDFVFLDVDLGPESELDGLTLCQRLHRRPAPHARCSPVLVLVSAQHSEADRVRGTLAGCDGYIGKPLDDDALRRVLSMHGVLTPSADVKDRAPA